MDDGDRKASEEEVCSVVDKSLILARDLESLLHLLRQVKGGLPGRPEAIVAHRCPSSPTLDVRYRSSSGDQSSRRFLAKGLRISLYLLAH